MNILFLTLLDFESLQERSIYTDLLREFVKNGHKVYAISPVERRKNQKTHAVEEENATILKLRIDNTQKTNLIKKGISTLSIEPQFISGIKKYFSNAKFNLVIYSTPPITFCKAVEFVKKRDGAKTYLLLKDIFPQNAVDIGIMSKSGVKGMLYKYFRSKEKKLYHLSDYIGCMSQANVDYVIKHNPEVIPEIVEICPNSIEVIDKSVDEETRIAIRNKYSIPLDKKVLVYGGNLGKPQGIPFLIKCLEAQRNSGEVFFLIVGDGTEYGKLEGYVKASNQANLKLMKSLPKEDYDVMVGACDVGLIFLDYRFTIPNFPSRLLPYMQNSLPVIACTDKNTDIGRIIEPGDFGWWCESNNVDNFTKIVDRACSSGLIDKGINAKKYLTTNYTVDRSYEIIMENVK